MLESAIARKQTAFHHDAAASGRHQILKMKSHDRMAGSVPVWEARETARDGMVQRLAYATEQTESFDTALAYAARQSYADTHEEPFGFGDLVDMVNPLHHVPVVGSIYRGITGDDIRPVSKIIGGGIFGGPAGAATGLVNTIVEHETGHDIAGNVISFVHQPGDGKLSVETAAAARTAVKEDTPTVLPEDLPGTVVRYTDLGLGKRRVYKQTSDNDRMAGSMARIYTEIVTTPPEKREPVRKLVLDPLPPVPSAT